MIKMQEQMVLAWIPHPDTVFPLHCFSFQPKTQRESLAHGRIGKEMLSWQLRQHREVEGER